MLMMHLQLASLSNKELAVSSTRNKAAPPGSAESALAVAV